VTLVARISQLDTNREVITALRNSTRNDTFDVKLTRYRLRIYFFSFVAKDRTTRDYSKLGRLRKAVDETVCDTIRKVFCVRVGIDVYER